MLSIFNTKIEILSDCQVNWWIDVPFWWLLTEFLICFRSHGILLPMIGKGWNFLLLLNWSIENLQELSLDFHRQLVVQFHIVVIRFKSYFHNSYNNIMKLNICQIIQLPVICFSPIFHNDEEYILHWGLLFLRFAVYLLRYFHININTSSRLFNHDIRTHGPPFWFNIKILYLCISHFFLMQKRLTINSNCYLMLS